MIILLDMDEVLVDFVGGMCGAWGINKTSLLQRWPVGRWDMVPPLAAALGRPEPMSQEEFWDQINGSEEFWLGLRPMPWFADLITLVESYSPEWHVISSPSYCVSSYTGKVRWLKNRFGSDFTRFALTPHKYLFAQPGAVLIDDRESNVEAFVKAGGRGIVFPHHHNGMHCLKDDPLKHVRAELERIRVCT